MSPPYNTGYGSGGGGGGGGGYIASTIDGIHGQLQGEQPGLARTLSEEWNALAEKLTEIVDAMREADGELEEWESPAAKSAYRERFLDVVTHIDKVASGASDISHGLELVADAMEDGRDRMDKLYTAYQEAIAEWEHAEENAVSGGPGPPPTKRVELRYAQSHGVGTADGSGDLASWKLKWDEKAKEVAEEIADKYTPGLGFLASARFPELEVGAVQHPAVFGDLPPPPPGGGGAPPPPPAAGAPPPPAGAPALGTMSAPAAGAAAPPPPPGLNGLATGYTPPQGFGDQAAPQPPPVTGDLPGFDPGDTAALAEPPPAPPVTAGPGILGPTPLALGAGGGPTGQLPPGFSANPAVRLGNPQGLFNRLLGGPGVLGGQPPAAPTGATGGPPPGTLPPGARMPPGGPTAPPPGQARPADSRRDSSGTGRGGPPAAGTPRPPGAGAPPGTGAPPGRSQAQRPGDEPGSGATLRPEIPEAFLPPGMAGPPVLGDPGRRRTSRPGGRAEAPGARGTRGGGGTPAVLRNQHYRPRKTFTETREANRRATREQVARLKEQLKSAFALGLPDSGAPVLEGRTGHTGAATGHPTEIPAALRAVQAAAPGVTRRPATPDTGADRATRRIAPETPVEGHDPHDPAVETDQTAWEVETPGGPVVAGQARKRPPKDPPPAIGGRS